MRANTILLSLAVAAVAIAACASPERTTATHYGDADLPTRVAEPMTDLDDVYAAAARVTLPEREPEEWSDLHNVYRLSDNIITGSEPLTREALERVADMGVRTVVSTDGKAPDLEGARALGLRYVHIPLQYKVVTDDQWMSFVKTFRELEGPFYVHCFHGVHRGPAAAAVGRLVLDGVSREQAIAEMRQWCGTSEKYTELYRAAASREVPSVEESEAFEFDFPESHRFEGLRGMMVAVARVHDNLQYVQNTNWQPNPEHPDVDPVQEARQLKALFDSMASLEGADQEPEDFREWMTESRAAAGRLASLVPSAQDEPGLDFADEADNEFETVRSLCKSCHQPYRNGN